MDLLRLNPSQLNLSIFWITFVDISNSQTDLAKCEVCVSWPEGLSCDWPENELRDYPNLTPS